MQRRGEAGPVDRGPVGEPLAAELRESLGALERTLQRLGLRSLPGAPPAVPASLLRRARRLAAELSEVVEAMLDPTGTRQGREPQQTLVVADAVADALSDVPDARVRVDCPRTLTVAAHPGRLHEVLVRLLGVAAPEATGAVLSARRRERELHLDVSGLPAPATAAGPSLGALQGAAASLGGRLEIVRQEASTTLRIRLPQQRADDALSPRPEGSARSR